MHIHPYFSMSSLNTELRSPNLLGTVLTTVPTTELQYPSQKPYPKQGKECKLQSSTAFSIGKMNSLQWNKPPGPRIPTEAYSWAVDDLIGRIKKKMGE